MHTPFFDISHEARDRRYSLLFAFKGQNISRGIRDTDAKIGLSIFAMRARETRLVRHSAIFPWYFTLKSNGKRELREKCLIYTVCEKEKSLARALCERSVFAETSGNYSRDRDDARTKSGRREHNVAEVTYKPRDRARACVADIPMC